MKDLRELVPGAVVSNVLNFPRVMSDEEVLLRLREHDEKVLSCGHRPTIETPRRLYSTGVLMFPGYGRTAEGKELCLDCSNRREKEAFLQSREYTAYLNMGVTEVQIWPGGTLARIIQKEQQGARWSVVARDDAGLDWVGKAEPGEIITLKRRRPR